MIECVSAEITKNIICSLHSKSIEYNNDVHTICVDTERLEPANIDRYPHIMVIGPHVEVTGRANQRCNCNLYYTLLFVENRIKDEPQSGRNIMSIADITRNVAADLIRLLFVSRDRGGWAINTTWETYGHFIDVDQSGIPLFYVYLNIVVKALINDTNPYERG